MRARQLDRRAIAGRIVQGVAGGVFPLAFGIVRDTFPPERVATGLGTISAIFGIGGGIGLPLSGVMVDNFDISRLFWISLIALPAALAAQRLIPESAPVERTRIDWLGAGLLSVALASILLGVTEANSWGWDSARTLGLIAGGLVVLVVWTRVERKRPDPLIDLGILSERAVATTKLTGFMIGFAMFSSFLLIPQFAQAPESTGYGFGASVTEAGLLLFPPRSPSSSRARSPGAWAARSASAPRWRWAPASPRRRSSCSRSSTATSGTS